MARLALLVLAAAVLACAVSAKFVPVYVMMNLDWVDNSGHIVDQNQLVNQLNQLKSAGTDGINVDVWWGIVEQHPGVYSWDPYVTLVKTAQSIGLEVQAIMSFHQCGGNVNDDCNIPLPSWVLSVGNSNPDIYYTDREGHRDPEYLSLGVDEEPLFGGRTPVQMYADYMRNFSATFDQFLGSTITEVQVGLGPAGELRYPSYQSAYWVFPGVGEFICYDRYMLGMLAKAANESGNPLWGHGGPNNAGNYNSMPDQTGFFNPNCNCENFASPYGQFFLDWYSSALIAHGERVLAQAKSIFAGTGAVLAAKISGVHWQYFTPSHAAELTAGYKNDKGNAYTPIAEMFARNGVMFDFTCLEMQDSEQPASCACGPVELVGQTMTQALNAGLKYSGENALVRYDNTAYSQIEYESDRIYHPINGFTYLRLSPTLLQGQNWNNFKGFVYNMHNLL